MLVRTEAFKSVTPDPPGGSGVYEGQVEELIPAIYLQFRETSGTSLADSSGFSRTGTLNGSGATLGATALAPNVGTGNLAVNLGPSGWIAIPHHPDDIALTFSTASPWNGVQTGFRFIADCTISLYFKPNSLPTGSNKAVVVAKSSSQTPGTAASYDGSFEAYLDSAGALHVECRSFRGRPCRIRTPNGAVSVGTSYHLAVQLGYDGVAAWLNGAKFEDGYASLLHVYGLGADIRGSVVANTNAWTIGKAAWGGQSNIQVDEFAVYLRTPTTMITQANVNSLAQVGGTPTALAHFIWGQRSVNRSSFASINAAIDNVNSLGGGTVLVNPGTYTENVTLKSNVRLKANGGTVNINGSIRTPLPGSRASLSGGGDLATGSQTIAITNSRSVGDVVRVKGLPGTFSPEVAATRRADRFWNPNIASSNDFTYAEGEVFEIESRNGSSMTFTGKGSVYNQVAGADRKVEAVTPTTMFAVEGDFRAVHGDGSAQRGTLNFSAATHFRIVGGTFTQTANGGQCVTIGADCIYGQLRDCTGVMPTEATFPSMANLDGIRLASCKDVVFKNCTVKEGRHAVDFSADNIPGLGASNDSVPCIRGEAHSIGWTHSGPGDIGQAAAYGAHGLCRDCIIWNVSSNMGGPAPTGQELDFRWMLCGSAAFLKGDITINDGALDCWLRDSRVIRANGWFRRAEKQIHVDRCHFSNVTHSSAPVNDTHNVVYGDGAAGGGRCTYTNVNTPSGAWIEI